MIPQFSLLAFGLFSGLASAQYQIAPSSVPQSTRDAWCLSQTTQCPLICLQYPGSTGARVNQCFTADLSYACVCSNGISPNASEYSQTLPYYVCTEWGNQCVKNCGNANSCADDCRTKHPCGARDPTRVNSTIAATMAATSSAGASTQTFGAFGASSSSSVGIPSYTASYTHIGNKFGFMAVGAGVVAGLALFLS